MISHIRAAKGDYYKVLGVEKGADDEEIKKAYRKMALKLHPDKCTAAGAEEAFKEVSKAFSCLTDPDKRAFYDRTGHEDMASASAARSNGHGHHHQHGMHHDIDPEELFNMMFGGMGGAFGMGPMHFGGFRSRGGPPPRPQRPQPQDARPANQFAGSIPPVFEQLLRMLARGTLYQKIMMGVFLLQLLPMLVGLLSWLWWVLLLGVPLYLVSHEVAAFDRRPAYGALRAVPYVRDAVRSVQPFAATFVGVAAPVAALFRYLWQFMLSWAQSLAV